MQFLHDFIPKEKSAEEIFYSFIASHYHNTLLDALELILKPFGNFKNKFAGISHIYHGFSILQESII